jgi:hypothetical protein
MIKRAMLAMMFLMVHINSYAASNVKLEDRKTSGNKVNIDKIGTKYGIVDRKMPIATATASSQVSCTGSSATVMASNDDRVIGAWLNQSAAEAFVCMTGTCTSTTGIRLQENQGYVAEHYTGAVSCITSAGTATLGVYEN